MPILHKKIAAFPADPLEQSAREILARALENPADPLTVKALYSRQAVSDPHERERTTLRAQLETLLDMRQNLEITRDQLTERRRPLERRLRELEQPLRDASTMPDMTDIAAGVRVSTNTELSEFLDTFEVVFRLGLDKQSVELVSFKPY